MPTKQPRINLVLDRPTFNTIKELSERNDVSLSSEARLLLEMALERVEDIGLARFADDRMKTFDREKALSFSELMNKVKSKK